MKYFFFASFGDRVSARAAVRGMNPLTRERARCVVLHHRGTMPGSVLQQGETHVLGGALQGLVGAGLVGALVGGFVVGPLGLVGGATSAALFVGMAAAAYGMLAGGLVGAAIMDPNLRDLDRATAPGGVLLSVEAPDLDARRIAERAFRDHGGVVRQKFAI